MNRSFLVFYWVVALAVLSSSIGQGATPARVPMPEIFSDNMVLQREVPVPVWGNATPGESISIQFKGQEKFVAADVNGQWKVNLDPMPASSEPSTLSVISSAGKSDFHNVLVGEVWLCSGQSNMQVTPKMLGIADEIQNADNPQIRLFSAPRAGAGKWIPCTTEAARAFSATGYYFGDNLWKQLQVPVGVIVAAEGCSSVETWMPPESILANDSLLDQNGCKLVDEMESFRKFHESYRTLSDEEKSRVFAGHCKSNYVFARSYLDMEGNLKAGQGDSILWHMSVIKPAFSYNKFIAKILPYAIKGVAWYQGETNALAQGDPQYADKQRILIEGWRKQWNQGELPFLIVQIAPCQSYPLLTDFWLQQYLAVRNTPGTALVTTVDIGDLKDAHPKNKRDVGLRLALLALKDVYGRRETVASGPAYKSLQVSGSTVEVAFDNAGTGLATKDGQPPDWFEVAGPDKKFQKARAGIAGDKVVITSPLENPEYVRFAWNFLAEPNLRNKEGLPALPFNTAEVLFHKTPAAGHAAP